MYRYMYPILSYFSSRNVLEEDVKLLANQLCSIIDMSDDDVSRMASLKLLARIATESE